MKNAIVLFTIICIVLIINADLSAQEIREVGLCNTPGFAHDIVVSGNYACVADWESGLQIIDVSNPSRPRITGSFNTPGEAQGVQVRGDIIYVADGEGGLYLLDISDPEGPDEVSVFNPEGRSIEYIFVSGRYAYLGVTYEDEEMGSISFMRVLDISDPTNLVSRSRTAPVVGYLRDIFVDGNLAYMGLVDWFNETSGVFIYDISNPGRIRQAGLYEIVEDDFDVRSIFVSGDCAFVANGGHGLSLVDVSDPENCSELGSFDTPGNARGVFSVGDITYVSVYNRNAEVGSILALDTSDPENPVELCARNLPGAARDVFPSGDYIYVADGFSGLCILEGSACIGVEADEMVFGAVKVSESRELMVNISNEGLTADLVISEVTVDGNFFTTDFEEEIAIEAGDTYELPIMFVPGEDGEHEAWLMITSNDPENQLVMVVLTGQGHRGTIHDTPGTASGVFVSENCAYVADAGSGLRLIDVSDPLNPNELGGYDTPGEALDVVVREDFAYVADGGQGLRVIDIYDSEELVEAGFYEPPGIVRSVKLLGDYAYIAADAIGLRVVDVSNPEQPEEVGFYDTRGQAHDVALSGPTAYIADGNRGLIIVNVEDPGNPSQVGTFDTDETAIGVAVAGELVYVADEAGGLRIIDVSDPGTPVETGSFDTPGNAISVFIARNHAFVTDEESGLYVIDISSPENPEEFDSYYTPGSARGVFVSENNAYVADAENGLFILDISMLGIEDDGNGSLPVSLQLYAPYPNPFNSTTTITYGLPYSCRMFLQLYNPAGKLLNTIFEGYTEKGFYTVNLSANDLPSGFYFVRLATPEQELTRKITTIR